MPQLEEHPFADELDLQPGVNVLELGLLSEEVQAPVLSSYLTVVQDRPSRSVVVILEAWFFFSRPEATR